MRTEEKTWFRLLIVGIIAAMLGVTTYVEYRRLDQERSSADRPRPTLAISQTG